MITCTIESALNQPDTRLDSIRLTDDYVFALTQNGLYRAAPNEQRWSYLRCPHIFGAQGSFAGHVHSTDPIILITDQGLFSTSDNGSTWRLVSNAYQFSHAFLHPDGTLYAIAAITFPCAEPIRDAKAVLDSLSGASLNRTCFRNIVVMSSDFGQNWHDISGNIAGGVSLYGIFQDPNHPDLIILSGNSVRNYILQATDKNYGWQMHRTLDWLKTHTFPGHDFFTKAYATQTTLYMLPATLANYFDHDFGEQVGLPGFDISTDQAAYTFTSADSKIVSATVKFLPTTDSDQLVDLMGSADLWGIRVVDGAGHHTDQSAKLTQLRATSSDKTTLAWQYRDRPDFYKARIDHTQVYTKTIDLDDLFNFSTPGVYQVQITYDNTSIAESDHGEWVGYFSGSVFTVTVKDR